MTPRSASSSSSNSDYAASRARRAIVHLTPARQAERLRAYASAVLADCSADQITAVSRFDSGERHAVYKVSYLDPQGGAKDVVVRIATSDDALDRAGVEREAVVLAKVQGIAAPVVYDFRVDSPWFDAPSMCMQFIPGAQRELTAVAPSDIEHLGSVVAQVHELPIDDLGEWFPTTTTTAEYLDARLRIIVQKLPSVHDPLPASVQRRLHDAVLLVSESSQRARTGRSYATDNRLVLLHGDVAAGNIVWGQAPVLIDWEYARIGDPADEVAYIFGQNDLDQVQREAFWTGYRRTVRDDERLERIVGRVDWWEPANLLGSALWWVERWSARSRADAAGEVDRSVPKALDYYLGQALRRLDRFERLVRPGPVGS